MLPLDAAELYDLSEAGRLLWAGPGRIGRWIRLGKVPATRREQGWQLPRAWVDAACGREATDEDAVRRYWLERLAPPPREAGRPLRDRRLLEAEMPGSQGLLAPADAARRVFVDEARLERLAADGTLPALRIDGQTHYDETLVDLLARADLVEGARADVEARRAVVQSWARYEYATDLEQGAAPPPAATRPAAKAATAVAPHAWRMPDDLAEDLADVPALLEDGGPADGGPADGGPADGSADTPDPSRLIQTDGFETVDED